MKTFLKTFCLISLISVVSGTTFAKDTSTVLLSAEKQSYSLDFLNVDGITGLQFDVKFNGLQEKNLSLSSCVSGVAKTHAGACRFVKNGNLRVIIFSPTNAVLESGNIGLLKLNGGSIKNIEISKVTMVRPDLKEIKGAVMVDMGGKSVLDRDSISIK